MIGLLQMLPIPELSNKDCRGREDWWLYVVDFDRSCSDVGRVKKIDCASEAIRAIVKMVVVSTRSL